MMNQVVNTAMISYNGNKNYKILFFSYIIFIMSLLLQNNIYLPAQLFNYIVVPAAIFEFNLITLFIGVLFSKKQHFRPSIQLRAHFKQLNKILLAEITIFISSVVCSTYLYPFTSLEWLWSVGSYGLMIFLFVVITAQLNKLVDKFYLKLFSILTIATTVNALINITIFFLTLDSKTQIGEVRFYPTFGVTPDHFPTTGSLVYATVFSASICLFFQVRNSLLRWIFGSCSIFLFITILLTQCRSSLFAIFPILGLLLFTSLESSHGAKISNTKKYLISITLITIIIIIAFIIYQLFSDIRHRYLLSADGGRFEIWSKFIEIISQRPALGYGERTEFAIKKIDGEYVGHPHNLLLSAATRGGFFAVLSLAFILYSVISRSFIVFFNTKNAIPLSLTIVMFITGAVDYDLLVFLPDWQWLCYWLPLGIMISNSFSNDA
jgi:hypothetical protein